MTPAIDLVDFDGPCWRAIPTGGKAMVLDGTTNAGRYNRPGERTLYMSGSREGAAAAMTRYASMERNVVPLRVAGARLIDLRPDAVWTALGIDAATRAHDWMAVLDAGGEPVSWRAADAARAIGADGVIAGSRHLPGAFHLVLFDWNKVDRPRVTVEAS